jgi:hypothetical protein
VTLTILISKSQIKYEIKLHGSLLDGKARNIVFKGTFIELPYISFKNIMLV